MRTLMITLSLIAMTSAVSACSMWHDMWNDNDSTSATRSDTSMNSNNTSGLNGMNQTGAINAMGNQNDTHNNMKTENYVGDMYKSPKIRHHDR